MIRLVPLPCLALLLALPAPAEESLTLPPALPAPGLPAAATPEVDAAPPPVVDDRIAEGEQQPLTEGEARIRAGIVLQDQLLNVLASIEDNASAEAAVAPIMRLVGAFQTWAQSFAALPPLDDETRLLYERRYLPIIHELNESIRAQGSRIASAEFYGSADLPAALARLVISAQ